MFKHTQKYTHSHACTHIHVLGLRSMCVDPKQGIFLVRKASSGIDTPVHVLKRTGTSNDHAQCELDVCTQLSQAAARGNQPGFECEHLRAVQNAESFVAQPVLLDWAMDEMIEHHWLKESRRKDCVQLRAFGLSHNVTPIYPWFPDSRCSQRYLHFSVVSGTKTSHYWCRFGRVVVSFDTHTAVWKCACSPAKRSCVHKALSMWFTCQELPHVMSKASEVVNIEEDQWWQDDFVEEEKWQIEENTEEHMITHQTTTSTRTYPPTGSILTRMLRYIQANKKIPSSLPQELLKDEHLMRTKAITCEETHCQLCPTNPILEDSILITSQAQIVTLAGVKKGM